MYVKQESIIFVYSLNTYLKINADFTDELPSSSPHVLPPANGAGGSPPDTGGQISNPATDAPAPIPPPVPASAPVPTAPSPPSPTLPPHISQPPVSKCNVSSFPFLQDKIYIYMKYIFR